MKKRMEKAAKLRPEYGRAPFQPLFDDGEDWKMRNLANPPFDIQKKWWDLILVFMFYVMKLYMLRGQKEVSTQM